ncbi:Transposase [compost metagenome]
MPQERRSYSKSFKTQVITECAQPDTSIANVALTHNLNTSLAHKLIRMHAQKNLALQTAFSGCRPDLHKVSWAHAYVGSVEATVPPGPPATTAAG